MGCKHHGFHEVNSTYDRERGVLVYFWTCAFCGSRLHEAGRFEYRPSFIPHSDTGVETTPSPT